MERLSIELTNRCGKACWFCYNGSHGGGDTVWTVDALVSFVRDCAAHGTKAVSFGGGEPLQFAGLFDVLRQLDGVLFRSITSNGLLFEGETFERLVAARPDKVHVSIHFPGHRPEVERVIRQVKQLEERGIKSGVNLLVMRSRLADAEAAARQVRDAGIGNDRIVYLPMRGQDTPTPEQVARVAGGGPFQSTSCLAACGKSPRFVSIGWDRRVAWCSYTAERRPLDEPTHAGLVRAAGRAGADLLRRNVMATDYPAAHSMDTTWFAVDAKGQVAMFTTGENGHLPEQTGNDLQDDLLGLSQPAAADFLWGEELAQTVGVYYYDFAEESYHPIGRYARQMVPPRPIHVDQLRPDLREQCRRVVFDQVDFAAADFLQPNEYVRCIYWYSDIVAYLCADGVTVRPVPGKEGAFAAFVHRFRHENAEAARGFVFDGPTE
ncbi:MAG: radical SAM protein [Gemmataceae bacterium]